MEGRLATIDPTPASLPDRTFPWASSIVIFAAGVCWHGGHGGVKRSAARRAWKIGLLEQAMSKIDVEIVEVGPRDGLQNLAVASPTADKCRGIPAQHPPTRPHTQPPPLP